MIKNIAIYRSKGIGDVILSFKGINELRQYPVQIYFIGYGSALLLVKYFFPEVKVIDIGENGLFKSYSIIRSNIFQLDGLIDLQKNSRSILLRIMLYLKFRMPIFRLYTRSIVQICIVIMNKITGRRNQFDFVKNYTQLLVEDTMCNCINMCIQFLWKQELFRKEKNVFLYKHKDIKTLKTLYIAPGGSHHVKHLPPELIFKILDFVNLSRTKKYAICLIGDENDVELCNTLEKLLKGKNTVQNMAGKLDITELPEFLSKANILLASDSAISHLGGYMNIPKAVLMGSTLEGFGYGLINQNSRVFSSNIKCRPCSRHGDKDCLYHDKLCLNLINAEDVAKYLSNYLF